MHKLSQALQTMLAAPPADRPAPTLNLSADIPYEVAYDAHAGTSHSPDRRADQEIAAYVACLTSFREELVERAKKAGTEEKVDPIFQEFREGYKVRVLAVLRSRNGTMSTLITGAGNFPVARMNKRIAATDKKEAALLEWARSKRANGLKRVFDEGTASIMTGDPNAISRLQEKLAGLKAAHAKDIEINQTIRKNKKAGSNAQSAALAALGYGAGAIAKLLSPDFMGRIGIAEYVLTNRNRVIRDTERRLDALLIMKGKTTEVNVLGAIEVEVDYNANRVRMRFPDKPNVATRVKLKGSGFKWAPTVQAWQNYATERNIAFANSFAAEGELVEA